MIYTYDPAGQLLAAEYSGDQDDEFYWYDANGNRTAVAVGASTSVYVVGAGNRLVSDGTYWYEYDANGNRTLRYLWTDADADGQIDAGERSQITRYTWDGRNRLVGIAEYATEDGPARQVVANFYDAENRWIGQTVDRDGDGTVDHTRVFGYDGNQIVVQFDREGSGRVTGADQSHRYLWGPAVDQILPDEGVYPLPLGEGQGEGSQAGQQAGYDLGRPGEVLWPLTDHLGTVRDLAQSDPQTGQTAVVNHLVYDAFGRLLSETNPGASTLFAFTGRPFDAASGLQNNLNRWYDPVVARWLSPDPLGFSAGDANLYRYVGNRPQRYADRTGLLEIKLGGYVFYVHRYDKDPFPSQPHAHVGSANSPYKVNLETGEVFYGSTPTGRNIGKKVLRQLRARLRAAGLLGLAAVVVLETPEVVQAAERGGMSGVVGHNKGVATQAAIAMGESAIVGGAVLGGAALAGKSNTAGGATISGLSGATAVGGSVIAAGAGGYAVGYAIGSIQIGRQTIHEHLGAGMYSAAHAISEAGRAAWNWITDW
ncbi:RHS repeat-associated core domain-containing protein [Thermopirellula anaerolimosa]